MLTEGPCECASTDICSEMVLQQVVDSSVLTQYAVNQCRRGVESRLGKHVELIEKFGIQHDGVTHQSLHDIVGDVGL